jgi:hypothetical protein
MRFQLCLAAAFCAAFTFVSSTENAFAEAAKENYAAWVTKVDGEGTARLRRKAGTESVVGVDQKILPGDRITTDNRSIVELALNDGTIVRVGLNSEYKLESTERKGGIVGWVFSLAKGSIRALVEKSPDKKNVKFRVNTPSGTMGVRGTELVLDHNPTTKITTLYTLEGVVEFGSPRCAKFRKECIDVTTGEKATIGPGAQAPSATEFFTASDLVGGATQPDGEKTSLEAASTPVGSAAGGSAASLAPTASRMALFEGVKKAESRTASELARAEDISKMVKEASDSLAGAQDALLGRDKSQRETMYAAMADGTYEGYVKIAEKFDDLASGKPKSAEQRSTEAASTMITGKKFELGKKIVATGKVKAPVQKIEDLLTKAAGKFKSGSDSSGAIGSRDIEEAKKMLSKPKGTYREYLATLAARSASPTPSPRPTPSPSSKPDGLTQRGVADLLADVEFSNDYREYVSFVTMVRKECDEWLFLVCTDWDKEEYQQEVKEKVTSTVSRKSGACYSTQTTCQKQYTPCNQKTGKYCEPELSEEKCTTTEQKVACP